MDTVLLQKIADKVAELQADATSMALKQDRQASEAKEYSQKNEGAAIAYETVLRTMKEMVTQEAQKEAAKEPVEGAGPALPPSGQGKKSKVKDIKPPND